MNNMTCSRNGSYVSKAELSLTCAEFFAGIGLMRLGLEKQGWEIIFANDIDSEKLRMYQGHFGEGDIGRFILGDIHELQADTIPTVTLATASFPCNDLSLAGGRRGLGGAQSSAFWGFIEILKAMKTRRPPMVLLENVVGFLTSHGGADFEAALLALNELGYCVDTFMLDAVNFVPQSRPRLFVVGMLIDRLPSVLAVGGEEGHPARTKALKAFVSSHPNIDWRFRELPPIPTRSETLESILEDLPYDAADWWSCERAAYLLDQMSERHRRIADNMIAARRWSYGTVFRRMRNGRSMAELRTDGIAGCLRTPRGGSGRQILLEAGWGRYYVRLITPREAARLMGAGEFQMNDVSLNQALFGFGDAVCVSVVEWIAANVLNPMAVELQRSRHLRANVLSSQAAHSPAVG